MILLLAVLGALVGGEAAAHVSERALVLLLPTDVYIGAGMAVMVATVVLLVFVPHGGLRRAFRMRSIPIWPRPGARMASLLAGMIVLAAILAGFYGSRDPLSNPLPLLIWTLLWVVLPLAHAVFGNLWRWLNPWMGLCGVLPIRPSARLSSRWGAYPACAVFLGFALFMVADIAPADPARLAGVVLAYWAATLIGLMAFGPRWLLTAEPFTIVFRMIARLAPAWRRGLALPGSRLLAATPRRGVGLLALLWLAIGSFDGLNETFWWLAQIGINPLAFPGRSAVALPNAAGLIGGTLLLLAVFLVVTHLGFRLAGTPSSPKLIAHLMLTVLPIALGYHLAHYLTQLLVNGQYLLVVVSDPLGTGADWLGLGEFFVSTGFFNRPASVQAIWITQASAVVLGHCLSVVLAHAIALDALKSRRTATLSQVPLVLFMVAYTFFGLWLLAQPTGA